MREEHAEKLRLERVAFEAEEQRKREAFDSEEARKDKESESEIERAEKKAAADRKARQMVTRPTSRSTVNETKGRPKKTKPAKKAKSSGASNASGG